ncbi:uncharacterized protein [Miscanthus floridulus]|uniref:uncharacterized protein n=1 Tax=Miscanthus floridulus TaxID=154761 RepID=UPI003457833C
MAQILPGPGARVPPPLPDHLVEEILVRVASSADLVRASAACASFRRLVAAASFLRRYRSLHPPLLLGVLTARRFLPAEARHPNALTVHALFRAADFSQCQGTGWIYCDARAGRVLLMRSKHAGGHILPELAVCDPLTRGRTPLPTIPESLVASVLGPARDEHIGNFIAFFVPAADYEEAQYKVIAWTYSGALAVAFAYSSLSGTWTDSISISSDAPGFRVQAQFTTPVDLWPSYAYGCFYWKLQSCNKLLKLDINRMEFSVVGLPPYHEDRCVIVVEAGEGRIGIITRAGPEFPELLHSIWQNDAWNDNEHATESAIQLPSDYYCYFVFGVAEEYIIIEGFEKASARSLAFFSLNIKTLEIVRVCSVEIDHEIDHYSYTPFLYFGYPPFLSPRRI